MKEQLRLYWPSYCPIIIIIMQIQVSSPSKQIQDCLGIVKMLSPDNQASYRLAIQYQGLSLAIRAPDIEDKSEVASVYLKRAVCQDPKAKLLERHMIDFNAFEERRFKHGKEVGKNGIFVRLFLRQLRRRIFPRFVTKKDFKFDMFSSGAIVSLQQQGGLLFLKSYYMDAKQVKNFSLPIQSGLIFLFRKHKGKELDYFYGFYDKKQHSKSRYHDYHLYAECLFAQCRNEVYIAGHKVIQQPCAELNYPYNSIGIIVSPEGNYGTASLLFNKEANNCKYLITCAHNFIDRNSKFGKNLRSLSQYKFFLPSRNIDEQPDREVVKEVTQFMIKNIYIPQEYQHCIFSKDSQLQAKFLSNNQEEQKILSARKETLYDICVIELNEPLAVSHGFRLRKQEKQFREIQKSAIELAGYPRAEQQVKTRYFYLYHQSTQGHPSGYVELSNQISGTGCRIIRHKLSTLAGNSGSPIYEFNGKECYLFGVHTTGIGANALGVYGAYNLGTYIYSKRIINWLLNIEGIETVFDQ